MFERFRIADPVVRERASISQRARMISAALGHGRIFTELAVEAEVYDCINPETADPDVSPSDLLDFFHAIVDAKNSEETYQMLARPLPNNENLPGDTQRVWFDVIEGLTNGPVIEAVADTARGWLPTEKSRWEHAADLGAGTGKLGKLLLSSADGRPEIAEKVTLVDAVPELLSVAKHRCGQQAANFVSGDVLELPFTDESFDLMVSGGLAYMLGRENQTAYFNELHRLLKPGGLYIDGDQAVSEHTTRNPGRYRLNWFIKGQAAGPEMLGDPLSHNKYRFPPIPFTYSEKKDYFHELGFTMWQRVVHNRDAAPITVRILEKFL